MSGAFKITYCRPLCCSSNPLRGFSDETNFLWKITPLLPAVRQIWVPFSPWWNSHVVHRFIHYFHCSKSMPRLKRKITNKPKQMGKPDLWALPQICKSTHLSSPSFAVVVVDFFPFFWRVVLVLFVSPPFKAPALLSEAECWWSSHVLTAVGQQN